MNNVFLFSTHSSSSSSSQRWRSVLVGRVVFAVRGQRSAVVVMSVMFRMLVKEDRQWRQLVPGWVRVLFFILFYFFYLLIDFFWVKFSICISNKWRQTSGRRYQECVKKPTASVATYAAVIIVVWRKRSVSLSLSHRLTRVEVYERSRSISSYRHKKLRFFTRSWYRLFHY